MDLRKARRGGLAEGGREGEEGARRLCLGGEGGEEREVGEGVKRDVAACATMEEFVICWDSRGNEEQKSARDAPVKQTKAFSSFTTPS